MTKTELKPIRLTKENNYLLEYPSPMLNEHTADKDKLSCCIGLHKTCIGWVDIRKTTPTHNVILCRACGLRITIPNDVKTYGDLRKYINTKLLKEKK